MYILGLFSYRTFLKKGHRVPGEGANVVFLGLNISPVCLECEWLSSADGSGGRWRLELRGSVHL